MSFWKASLDSDSATCILNNDHRGQWSILKLNLPIYQCKTCSKTLVALATVQLYRRTTLKKILRNKSHASYDLIQETLGEHIYLFCWYCCLIFTISLSTVCTCSSPTKSNCLFLSLVSHFNKQSLAILIFFLPVCLYRPQCVCSDSTARPVRHGSTSALLANA